MYLAPTVLDDFISPRLNFRSIHLFPALMTCYQLSNSCSHVRSHSMNPVDSAPCNKHCLQANLVLSALSCMSKEESYALLFPIITISTPVNKTPKRPKAMPKRILPDPDLYLPPLSLGPPATASSSSKHAKPALQQPVRAKNDQHRK